jgi:hypothetical protein
MAAMTAVAIKPKIKKAMRNIGLGERTDDLLDMLDEIELDLMLKESEQDEKAGRFITIEEMRKRTTKKLEEILCRKK